MKAIYYTKRVKKRIKKKGTLNKRVSRNHGGCFELPRDCSSIPFDATSSQKTIDVDVKRNRRSDFSLGSVPTHHHLRNDDYSPPTIKSRCSARGQINMSRISLRLAVSPFLSLFLRIKSSGNRSIGSRFSSQRYADYADRL